MNTIYLQLKNSKSNYIIPQNSFVTFDAEPVVDSLDLQYINPAGLILIQEPGTYLVEWDVSAIAPSQIQLGLSTGTGVVVGSTNGFPGQISGSAVVVVTEASPVALQLINQSSASITCSDIPVVANLLIYAVVPDEDSGNNGDNGGTDGGSSDGTRKLTLHFSSGFEACKPSLSDYGLLANTSVIGAYDVCHIPVSSSVSGGTIIQLNYGFDNEQYIRSFPYKVRLISVSGVFNNKNAFILDLPTTMISPFVAIAKQAVSGTYAFNIIEESQTYPDPGFQMLSVPAQYIPNSTILTAVQTGMNIEIPAGEPFAIVGGFKNLGLSLQALDEYIYMHGSMVFEIIE